MQINSISSVQVNKIERNQNLQRKPVSFGNNSDEFVKQTGDKTYPEMVMEIQKKYQPQISSLRKQVKELAENTNKSLENILLGTKERRNALEYFFYMRTPLIHPPRWKT